MVSTTCATTLPPWRGHARRRTGQLVGLARIVGILLDGRRSVLPSTTPFLPGNWLVLRCAPTDRHCRRRSGPRRWRWCRCRCAPRRPPWPGCRAWFSSRTAGSTGPWRWVSTVTVRSPAAILPAIATAYCGSPPSCRVRLRVISMPSAIPASTLPSTSSSMKLRLERYSAAASSAADFGHRFLLLRQFGQGVVQDVGVLARVVQGLAQFGAALLQLLGRGQRQRLLHRAFIVDGDFGVSGKQFPRPARSRTAAWRFPGSA